MSEGLDPTTIIFALLAIIVVWKLRSVLGTRVDVESRPPAPDARSTDAAGKAVRLPGAPDNHIPPTDQNAVSDASVRSDKARAALATIAASDPKFSLERFVAGARVAYEMIVVAFASGDRKTLGNLLSPDVLSSFCSAIDRREAAGESAATRVASVGDVEIVDGAVRAGTAQISARISAKMTNVVHDKGGAVVSGDPDVLVSTDDLWTFSREIASSDPTWRLIATESHHQS
ncbi:MAG: Tim44 domain-containing protein [Hyphomicrobiales bacterium]|nr:Tim44 domain-containing protein [Hyphomicrobiales bacterium]